MFSSASSIGWRVGVHRVDAPAVAGVVMRRPLDAVDHRIAQVDVRARHVELGAQHGGAVGELAGLHLSQPCQVLGRRALAERAVLPRRREVAAVRPDLVGALLVDVSETGADQGLGGAVHEVEIVAREVEVRGRRLVRPSGLGCVPVEAEPADRVDDRVDVLLLFLLRVGVVEAQVADAAVFLRQPEVEGDALGVADVQVAVRLGRKAGANPGRVGRGAGVMRGVARRAGEGARGVGAGFQIALDDVAQEIAGRRGGFLGMVHEDSGATHSRRARGRPEPREQCRTVAPADTPGIFPLR